MRVTALCFSRRLMQRSNRGLRGFDEMRSEMMNEVESDTDTRADDDEVEGKSGKSIDCVLTS